MKKLILFAAVAAVLPLSFAKKQLDGEQVYRDNCTRCHIAIHAYSPRMLATITRHMQVRATLTSDEAKAVLEYLAGSEPQSKSNTTTTAANKERAK